MIVISFNSYKGGACRTTTCYNTLPYLAEKLGATSKQPILVFDTDLDSMGLTSLFIGAQEIGPKKCYSARHLFVDDEDGINSSLEVSPFESIEDGDWYFENFIKVGKHLGLKDDGSVLFCGADANADVISDNEINRMKDNSPLEKLLGVLRGMSPGNRPKAVVFDCASGVQLTTLNVITSVNRVVMCMRPTTQFRIGTRDYLLNKIPRRIKENKLANKNCEIVLLPTAVPPIRVDENESEENRKAEVKTLKGLRNDVYEKITDHIINQVLSNIDKGIIPYTLNENMVDFNNDDVIGIPEIQRFKWTESELLYNLKAAKTLSSEEKLLEERYIKLADILAKEI